MKNILMCIGAVIVLIYCVVTYVVFLKPVAGTYPLNTTIDVQPICNEGSKC